MAPILFNSIKCFSKENSPDRFRDLSNNNNEKKLNFHWRTNVPVKFQLLDVCDNLLLNKNRRIHARRSKHFPVVRISKKRKEKSQSFSIRNQVYLGFSQVAMWKMAAIGWSSCHGGPFVNTKGKISLVSLFSLSMILLSTTVQPRLLNKRRKSRRKTVSKLFSLYQMSTFRPRTLPWITSGAVQCAVPRKENVSSFFFFVRSKIFTDRSWISLILICYRTKTRRSSEIAEFYVSWNVSENICTWSRKFQRNLFDEEKEFSADEHLISRCTKRFWCKYKSPSRICLVYFLVKDSLRAP